LSVYLTGGAVPVSLEILYLPSLELLLTFLFLELLQAK
jgi:hypothetical protein